MMASLVNDGYSQSGHLVQRRYVQIPKDQKRLLENAWFETLNRGQHPMLNVPDGVISHVKDTFFERRRASLQQASSSAARPLPGSSSNKRLVTNQDDEAGESDREVSWPPSPEPDRRHIEEDGLLEDEPDALEPEFRPSSVHHHQRSSPPNTPLRRNAPSNFNNSEPQSSGAQSDGLDIEPPGFVTQEVEPSVNRTASRVIATDSHKLEATPPSAQMPVQTARDTQATAKPPPAKRRRMEGSHVSDKTREPEKPAPAVRSRQSPSSAKFCSNQNSLTISASSPLGVQCTRGGPNQSSEQRVMSEPARYQQSESMPPTYEGRPRESAQNLVIVGSSLPGPSLAPPPAQRVTVANRPSNSSSISQQPIQPSQTSASPYELFKVAYPDYCGNSRGFVAALLTVKKLMQNRELNQVLFDDFIRAYTGDYFVYVSESSRKDAQELLPGVQWYNEYVDDYLYDKRIVRKTNLAAFIAAHSEEAQSVRRAIRHGELVSSQNLKSHSTPDQSDQDMEGASDVDEEEVHAGNDEDELPEPELMQMDRDEAGAQASSDGRIELAGPVTRPTRNSSDRTAATASELPRDALVMTQLSDDFARQIKTGLKSLRQTQDLNYRAALEKAKAAQVVPVHANHGRESPELRVDAPGAAKTTASFAANDIQPRAQWSPSPLGPLMSHEISHKSLQPIASSSPGASPHNEQHACEEPTTSPLQRNARSSSLEDGPRDTIEAAGQDGDEVAAFKPLGVASRRKANPSSSHRRGSDISDDDDDAFDPPVVSRSQRRSRLGSIPKPISVSSSDSEEGGSPTLPLHQGTERSSINKLQDYSMAEDPEDPADAYDLPVLPAHMAKWSAAALLSEQAVTRGVDGTFLDEGKTDPYDVPVSSAQPIVKPPATNFLSSQAVTFGADETFLDTNTALKPRVSEKTRKVLAPVLPPKPTLSTRIASAAEASTERTSTPSRAGRRRGSQDKQTAASPTLLAKQTSPIGEATARSVVASAMSAITPPGFRRRSVPQPKHAITSPTPLAKSGSPIAKDIAQQPIPSTMPAAMPSGMEGRRLTRSVKAKVSPTPCSKPTVSTASAAKSPHIINSTMSAASSSGLQGHSVPEPKNPASSIARTSKFSMGTGPSHSRASSMSSVNGARMKQSERSKRLQEFARKRGASGTPASTAATAASNKH